MLRNFFEDEHAATLTEFGLIVGLVFSVSFPALNQIGDSLRQRFEIIGAAFTP